MLSRALVYPPPKNPRLKRTQLDYTKYPCKPVKEEKDPSPDECFTRDYDKALKFYYQYIQQATKALKPIFEAAVSNPKIMTENKNAIMLNDLAQATKRARLINEFRQPT